MVRSRFPSLGPATPRLFNFLAIPTLRFKRLRAATPVAYLMARALGWLIHLLPVQPFSAGPVEGCNPDTGWHASLLLLLFLFIL